MLLKEFDIAVSGGAINNLFVKTVDDLNAFRADAHVRNQERDQSQYGNFNFVHNQSPLFNWELGI